MTERQKDVGLWIATIAMWAISIATAGTIIVGCETAWRFLMDDRSAGLFEGLAEIIEEEIVAEEIDPEPEDGLGEPAYELPGPVIWEGDVTGVFALPGLILCTENYVASHVGGANRGGSVSFVHARFVGPWTSTTTYLQLEPRNQMRGPASPHCACPGVARNWTVNGDHPGDVKWYVYTTGHATKEPGADGTRMGYLWIPFPGPGEWDVRVKWRSGKNRTSRAYLCLVTRSEGGTKATMRIKRWNQRGDGGTYEILAWDGAVTE